MIGELAALGAAICWSISAVLYRQGLSGAKPISANIVRLAGTSIILILFLAVIGKFPPVTGLPTYAVLLASLSGLIGLGLGDTLYMVSLKLVGVARAVPITCTYPLFSLVIEVIVGGKTIALQAVVAAFAVVAGIWLLAREKENRESGTQSKVLLKGALFALATAIAWAASIETINMAVTLPETNTFDGALALNAIRVSSVAAFLLATAPITDRLAFAKMDRKTFVALIAGGIVALALGWFFLAFSFLYIPGSQAIPISSTSPLFAVVAGMVFLHERVTVRNVVGSVTIVLGVFLLFII